MIENRFDPVGLNVKDLDASIAFLKAMFDFNVIQRWDKGNEKKILITAVLVGCFAIMVHADPTNVIAVTDGVDLAPRTGISLADFAAAWPQIASQLPKDDTVLNVTVYSSVKIEIQTCRKDSQSRGTGGFFVFEKVAGNGDMFPFGEIVIWTG